MNNFLKSWRGRFQLALRYLRENPLDAAVDPLAGEEYVPFLPPFAAALHRKGTRSAKFLLMGLCGTFLVFLLWAAFAGLEENVRGTATIVPVQRIQHIQNLEGGILREILVREGQVVEKGTLLLRIDNEQAESTLRDAQTRILDLQAAIAALEAEIADAVPAYPEEVKEKAADVILRYNNLLEGNRKKFAVEHNALQAQLESRKHEAEEQRTKETSLQSALELAVQQRQVAGKLMATHSFSEMEYLNLKQKVVSLEGELSALKAAIPKVAAAIREAEERLRLHKAQADAENLKQINSYSTELASLREALARGSDKVFRTEVRSPVKGVVKRIGITTEGGVIMPGETIMDIVPVDDTLIVEAHISPKDIAFLFVGQKARVSLTAYDFGIYGSLDATVEHISADTIEGKNGDVYYLIRLRAKKAYLVYNDKKLPIVPGMTGTVDIIAGKKTVLDYLMKPLLKAKQSALSEK